MNEKSKSLFYDVIIKEGLKKLSWSLILIVFVFLLAVLDFFFEFPNIFGLKETAQYQSYLGFVRRYVSPVKDFTSTHPVSALLIFATTSVVTTLITTVVHLNRKIRGLPENIHSTAALGKVASAIGLIQRWPSAQFTGASHENPWEQIVGEINSPKNNSVRILAANGEKTFADHKSPLHTAITTLEGELRVILLDPECGSTAARAASVGTDPSDYKRSINRSKKFLNKLYGRGKPIRGRLFNGKPSWKLIITDDSAWVQYYIPGGPDVENSPMYVFENNDNRESFYNLFCREFERIWDHCGDKHFAGR